MPKLKVFRTPIGFHDAYVAAPSQKAALAAWGTTTNLFARGEAELVSDPDLAKAPLEHPGQVIRLPRGTAAEHLKALGRSSRATAKAKPRAPQAPEPKAERNEAASAVTEQKPVRRKPSKPRPSRKSLDAVEAAFAEAQSRHERQRRELAEKRRALELEQRNLAAEQAAELKRLDERRRKESANFSRRMEAWATENAK